MSVLGKLLVGTRKGPSGARVRQLKKLQRTIGVRFTDLSLLEQALTHRSYSHVTSQTRNDSNERMEFLGDSVLGLAVSQFLYLRFPERSEGALSKMKSLLVSRKVLSSVARDAGLGEYLLLSGEESDMGGRDRASILADSFEGVIGAIYLDQGYRAANKFIQRFLLANISEILKDEEHTNFKSLLQEYVQSKRLSHPVYRVRKE
jgi:ribonuclease-3